MTKMSPEVQEVFTKVKDVVFCTATPDGQANGAIVGMKKVIDDETIYLSDQFFKKTLHNIQANPKCSVVFWEGHDAFQIYGTIRYVNDGDEFAEQAEWVNAAFQSMGMPITAKGGCFISVDAVFTSSPGPMAGTQIA